MQDHTASATEVWLPIADFPGYEVSDAGQVRRGSYIKRQRKDGKGYAQVLLWRDHKSHTRTVSRLVAAAFLGPRPDGYVVRHRSGDNSDNSAVNLVYGTPADNEADKAAHGTKLMGEAHHQSKLTQRQVDQIRARFTPFSRTDGARALGREFGVSAEQVHNILNGKHWPQLKGGQ
jgi:hypothetical protein